MRPFLVFLFFPRHIRARGREMEPRGVSLASRVHAAPALLRDTTNACGERDDADDAQTSKSRWKKVATLGLAFAGNLAGGGSAGRLVATETWQGATSSEDEGSVRRYEHSDDSDVDAEGIETELTAAVPPTCKTFDASGNEDVAAKTSSPFSFATDVTWAYQNLRRVPPGLWRVFHPERLRALDISHNQITALPSALGRFVNLESLDCSRNAIKKLPPSLARCRRLERLAAAGNRLRRLGGWLSSLTALKRLECEDNPHLIDPPRAIVTAGGLAVLEYLRAARVANAWRPDSVVDLARFSVSAEREAARLSLPFATRETRRFHRERAMDTFFFDAEEEAMPAGDAMDDAFPPLTRLSSTSRDDAPAPGTKRASRILAETASRASGVDLRYLTFRPGFFSVFRRIARIDLTDARLVALPPALGALCANLETLVLDGNFFLVAEKNVAEDPPTEERVEHVSTRLSTSVRASSDASTSAGVAGKSDEMCAIPDLSRLPKLKTLSMRNCRHVSALPPWIAGCAALETLRVSSCALRAEPFFETKRFSTDGLRALASLRTLDVSRNGALRSLPRLPLSLRTLNCSECALENLDAVTDAAELRDLDAHDNRASALPEDFADLDALRAVDLRRNFLKSLDAPNMHRRAPRFLKLHFSANPLAHTPWWLADVPTDALEPRAELEKRAAFETRDLWRADRGDFRGPTSAGPTSDDGARSIETLRPTIVDLRGRGLLYAPSLVEFAKTLTRLDVSRNHLGFLPTHVSECARLRSLDVSHNELLFLPDVARLAHLVDLRASNNRLVKLPDSLSACVSLRCLYAGQNPELDALPNLEPCASLETLVVDRCALKVLPVSLAAAPRLTRLYVEGNPLTFPGPEVYERGGNAAVLRFIRDVRRTAEESREMREAREAFRAGADGGFGDDLRDEGVSSRGTKKKEKSQEKSLGALLWRDARRVVVRDDTAPNELPEFKGFDAENALLRAREMTAGVRAAEAESRLAASVAELEAARESALGSGDDVSRHVASVRSLREQAEEQRRLLAKFPTMATDFLAALQERLRDEKRALASAVAAKESADADVARSDARVAERQATSEALADVLQTVRAAKDALGVRRREAIMRTRAEALDATRKTATEGAAKAREAELVSRSLKKTSRAAVKRESSRRRLGGEHRDLGLRRADVTKFAAIEDKANKAWGRAQAALWMGAFRHSGDEASGSDREEKA